MEYIEKDATITAKGQTTVPKPVRQALGVRGGDKITYRIDEEGVTIRRADREADPAIASFLTFLANDIKKHPGNLKSLSPNLAKRIASLVKNVEVDLDAAIEGDVSL
jgi:antitoxin PrlF